MTRRFIDIDGGRRLYVVTHSPKGEAKGVALFDAGAFGIYVDGHWIARALAARGFLAYTFSRAGLYPSDPLPPMARPHPYWHAEDMDRLLTALDVTDPVLLVGHSMAGLRMHAFAECFPERVGAALFVDAVTPAQLGWTVRRKLVRGSSRAIGVLTAAMRSRTGRRAMRLYPNNIRLEGEARGGKYHSLTSPTHLDMGKREIIESTDPGLRHRLKPIAHCPVACVTATMVGRGAESLLTAAKAAGQWTALVALRRVGHAAILGPKPAETIADLGDRLWAQTRTPLRDIATVG